MKNQKVADEYHYLTRRLDEVMWAIEGSCDDIDCNQYAYKDLLKKQYRPVLEHEFSCMTHLEAEREALLRVLSLPRYEKERYKSCDACGKKLDRLGKEYTIVGYTKKIPNKKLYECRSFSIHTHCEDKVVIPEGWKRI